MTRATSLLCIRAAVPMVILLFGGLSLSGFIYPLSPNAGAHEIAQHYRDHTDRIRFGTALSFLSIILIFPFGAAIAAQTRRIKSASLALTYTQVAAMASGSIVFVMPWVCWMVAAFRPERGDGDILLINDLGWLFFTFSFVAFTSWNFAIGAAILADTDKRPVYPRWLGYYNIFVGLVFIPDILVPFFKTGPFDWRGIVPYWFPFAVYGVWILMMMVWTTKAINQEAEGTEPERPVNGVPPVREDPVLAAHGT
jgi:hypothetical protein